MHTEKKLDFSIVTASYNYADYISDMLDSVADQEGVTFEHIIQDAGSTDGALDIIRKYVVGLSINKFCEITIMFSIFKSLNNRRS